MLTLILQIHLGQFLYAVNPEASISDLAEFRPRIKSKDQEPSKTDDFVRAKLAQLEKDAKVTANAYVLQSSMLHDRFLVIDDTVWFLGNSLNTLGEKASLIVKLPNPDEIVDQLEGMLNEAISLTTKRPSQEPGRRIMKGFVPNIPIAPKAERPFPAKELFWGSQGGGQACFRHPLLPMVVKCCRRSCSLAKIWQGSIRCSRVSIVDEYLLIPDSGKPQANRTNTYMAALTACRKRYSITDEIPSRSR
ncbi:MAG: hypothetical protein U5J62_05430 [Desulfurivibrio sp.]|nr:hypothetical protein [Desulfurivibrio sp.]